MMLSYASVVKMGQNSSAPLLPISPNHSTKPSSSANTMSSATSQSSTQPQKMRHIWLITGPAGCGKSTVARYIADTMNLPFVEGDEYHPKANVDKMAAGIPLTDADRWDWLTLLRDESVARLSAGSGGVVLTCSALKRKYRDVIRVASYYNHDVLVHFVYLHADEQVLVDRVMQRKNHFMTANMVHSQFDALEEPGPEETDVMVVDVSGSVKEVEEEALRRIHQAIEREKGGEATGSGRA